ncbi:DUF6946 family protein [Paraburkholderia lacunae]|uniref:DUF6946 domain-containing protein n=1 Tax=Paraburkholderia lacunae TaxID=2211104 RepID=A0A370MZ25_9BURK|nr:hypothetical protein [Paraburkholderia lacunae]RDJ98582.1 hypothetical protein DLM46_33220 [Paraburkholderia lacunae]
MGKIYIPANNAEDWAQFLAEPVRHWRIGYSARSLAHCWQDADSFPPEVSEALSTSEALCGTTMLLGIPEHQVALPGGSTKSQSDIWVLGKRDEQLVSIAIEGKVREPFGSTVAEWLESGTPGKRVRLQFLIETLGLHEVLPSIRYQLLHRTASAILEAERFNAGHALMLVHSFSQTQDWFEDYQAFAALFGIDAEVNRVHVARKVGKVTLHLGWVCGSAEYLSR